MRKKEKRLVAGPPGLTRPDMPDHSDLSTASNTAKIGTA
jgi:hypothetical protein